ncbi:antibiotic biosynthesis monooxygenase [Ornithinibacter sp.]|uniref:putative quinol monooxygenase n=1 Tax=Ornithinibacter sp. TaxID=2862748 RepID=UPI001B54EEEE|nr:antibiotic biosynthesis monooxygenase [Ornithinibacter sp.]MBP6524425.1 antibiotic biosynthesis monooxygenase [Dermatophilaceae bacterium]MBU9943433.1 antibiotic biosynthesis monooxygenase [Dermatophilaceae bacterium]HQX87694.1 antibiotic biosynthesis monooxygenase [Ornithinibacter sp.]HQZ09761.1 antibiotic biosynthesis monooxygenase [Ornithinibacter sp.]HRA26548.1 antibiotic biosynthesis monooxygenase [Ornithinibacter sp.]
MKESADPEEEQMSQFGLVVRFALKPGCAEAFDALMRETVAGIAAHEPRTLAYAVHALEAEPDVRIFYELYADEDALAEHEAQATTRYFLDRVGDYVTSTDVQRLHLVTATGIQGAAAAATE